MKKKQIPFNILSSIEAIAKDNFDIIQYKETENSLYYFRDREEGSNYYFQIIENAKKANFDNIPQGKYPVKFYPTSINEIKPYITFLLPEEMSKVFGGWVESIRKFNSFDSILDDPFEKKYEASLLEDFKILDEDANYSPFDLSQQDVVLGFLENFTTDFTNDKGQIDQETFSKIKDSIQDLTETIQLKTKNEVWKKIMNIAAKLFKSSKPLGKKFLNKLSEEVIKELVAKSVQYGHKVIKLISDIHDQNIYHHL